MEPIAAAAAPAVFDTSVFIGREGRSVGDLRRWVPVVSVVTIAELALGVRMATTDAVSARRAATLVDALRARVVPVNLGPVIDAWCDLRVALRRTMPAHDSWIAATALALRVPVLTQDDDFEAVASLIHVERV